MAQIETTRRTEAAQPMEPAKSELSVLLAAHQADLSFDDLVDRMRLEMLDIEKLSDSKAADLYRNLIKFGDLSASEASVLVDLATDVWEAVAEKADNPWMYLSIPAFIAENSSLTADQLTRGANLLLDNSRVVERLGKSEADNYAFCIGLRGFALHKNTPAECKERIVQTLIDGKVLEETNDPLYLEEILVTLAYCALDLSSMPEELYQAARKERQNENTQIALAATFLDCCLAQKGIVGAYEQFAAMVASSNHVATPEEVIEHFEGGPRPKEMRYFVLPNGFESLAQLRRALQLRETEVGLIPLPKSFSQLSSDHIVLQDVKHSIFMHHFYSQHGAKPVKTMSPAKLTDVDELLKEKHYLETGDPVILIDGASPSRIHWPPWAKMLDTAHSHPDAIFTGPFASPLDYKFATSHSALWRQLNGQSPESDSEPVVKALKGYIGN